MVQLVKLRRRLLVVLADLKLAIALLIVIALFSITGTVIEQGETPNFYEEHYPLKPALFGFLTYKLILRAGLNQVYSSWWYLTLLMLFGASLLACTFYRQLPLLKVARRWHYYSKPESIAKLPIYQEITAIDIVELSRRLQRAGFQIFHHEHQLYARKGLVGRIAPIAVHISIIIILAGAIWGAMAGFTTQEMIPSGAVQNLTLPHHQWQVKVHRFWIDYDPKGRVEQFYSDLSLLDAQGRELIRKTIHVNEPLRFQGVTFYQASWDITGMRFQINQSPVLQLPLQKLEAQSNGSQVWGTWLPTKPDLSAGVTLITPDLQGTFVVYDPEGKPLTSLRVGQTKEINGVNLTIKEVIGATGLQIKSDPSIPLVYAGFGLLMVSVIGSYISYSQVWAIQQGDRLYVGGKTNRAPVQFSDQMASLLAGN